MKVVHVWEKIELSFVAEKTYGNPYMDVDLWVFLEGPGFAKKVPGFWDGDDCFKVRIVATKAGKWSWQSDSNRNDHGLKGQSGTFEAIDWSDKEKEENLCRRGFIRSSDNNHAFALADGTPFYYLADTWWAVPTDYYKWYEDDAERPLGPDMGFKDMVKFRKKQGFNGIAILAAHPTWSTDDHPARWMMEDGTVIRAAWQVHGGVDSNKETAKSKHMRNAGGAPFLFPGRVPDYEESIPDLERINPDYFRVMDRKIDYLNTRGMIPFIEAARRDISQVWKKFYPWPYSYARYVHYIYARYQAHNALLSPIHFDYAGDSIPSREYNEPANLVDKTWGPPPFGTMIGTNSSPSSLVNFGRDARWLTFHQIGNWRSHENYWYLTEIYREKEPKPALNGEPYYPGFPDNHPDASSETADRYCRSGMYGSFLSGGLAGYMYGAEGLWGADTSPHANYRMWDALQFKSGEQVRFFYDFVMSEQDRFQDLIPESEHIIPNKGAPDTSGFDGWAYSAHTIEKDLFMIYFEKGCPPAVLRSTLPDAVYTAQYYNPLTGKWEREQAILTDQHCRCQLPEKPDGEDWALKLRLKK